MPTPSSPTLPTSITRTRSNPQPPRLARHTTPTEHIDGFTIDEDDHHPLEAHNEEDEELDADQDAHSGAETIVASRDADMPGAGKKSASDAEKGFQGGQAMGAKKATTRDSQVEKWQDPETRAWKNDIVTFDTVSDPANPKNWSPNKKLKILACYGLTTMTSTFASSVFSSASKYVAAEYSVSTEVMVLGVSLFVLGYIPGPLIFAPISEKYGRRMAILPAMFIAMCFAAATATAENLQTIFITRFFAGIFGSAPVVAVGGVLADMYDQKSRGSAVVFYSLAVVSGPTLGPIIGGAVSQSYLGWRWTMYLTVILIGVILILDLFIVEETYAPYLLSQKARALRVKTGRWALHAKKEEESIELKVFLEKNVLLPVTMLGTEPMVLLICLYNSFTYGILYMLFGAVPIVFEQGRGWNTLVGALPFLAVLLGTFVAAAINLTYAHFVFIPHLMAHGGKARPEMRLPPMMIGAVSFPIGFFLLGWTSNPKIFWFPSVLGLGFIGMSFLLIFQAGINYLIDSYTSEAASAIAANTFLRSIFAVGLPFAAAPLFNRLGIDWACTFLGCVAVLLGVSPFVFYKFGPQLRARSSRIKQQ